MKKLRGLVLMLLISLELVKLGYANVKEFGGIIDWPYDVVK